MNKIIMLTSLLLVSGIAGADKFDPNYNGGLDTSIDRVLMSGLWVEDEQYGRWRVISRNLGWEHTKSYLYIQRLRTDDKEKDLIEVETLPVSEFNDTGWSHIKNIEYEKEVFIVTYVSRIDINKIKKAHLTPGVPGQYEFIYEKK